MFPSAIVADVVWQFMVTDDAAFVTTSNWTPDYFLFTGGISLSTTSEKIR